VGGIVVLTLSVANRGEVPLPGLRIGTSGDWDKFTIVGVSDGWQRSGRAYLFTGAIAPGDTAELQVVLSANEPGNQDLHFWPESLDLREHYTDPSGQDSGLSGTVAVTP
jgi:hypothetical protein